MVLGCLAGIAALSALAGCATVRTAAGEPLRLGSDEFRAYVEHVFREQNRVGDEVAFALEARSSNVELAAAEQALLAACAGVNELATARRDQRRLGLRASVRAARSVASCERAARDAEARVDAAR
jgi:hypothetical protein